MLNSFETASFLKGIFDGHFLSACAFQMGEPEREEMIVLVLDYKSALKPWLAGLRPVIRVEHVSSGNVAPVLGLPSQGQQQTVEGVRGAEGNLLSSPFQLHVSGAASASGSLLWFVTVWTHWCIYMWSQACISSNTGGSVPVVCSRQQWLFLLQVTPAGLYGFLFSLLFDKKSQLFYQFLPLMRFKTLGDVSDSLVSYKTTLPSGVSSRSDMVLQHVSATRASRAQRSVLPSSCIWSWVSKKVNGKV